MTVTSVSVATDHSIDHGAARERARLTGITKHFGSFRALQDVSFDLRRGEVHALVGENGAGKSTLMKVLTGQLAADSGTLKIDGTPVSINRELHVRRAGFGFVEQEGGLIAELSAAENLALQQRGALWSRTRAAAQRIDDMAARLEQPTDSRSPIGTLPVGERQRLEIITVLIEGAEVLILDEPTASLSASDAARLSLTIRTFVRGGGTVVYISHKLKEVVALADRVTVMRRGEIVGHYESLDGVTVERLAQDMVGEVDRDDERKQLLDDVLAVAPGRAVAIGAAIAARLTDISVAAVSGEGEGSEALHDLSMEVRQGEILGVAGVVGSGQRTLAEVLVGLQLPHRGTVERGGSGTGYVPENRGHDAVALSLSFAENVIIHKHRTIGKGMILSRNGVQRFAERIAAENDVRMPGVGVPMSNLSGGNQQKAVVGRELAQAPALIVAHNPFRGLDVHAIHEVKRKLVSAAGDGVGVVLISSDLDEIFQVCSRIVVLFSGSIIGEVDPRVVSMETIGKFMGGAA